MARNTEKAFRSNIRMISLVFGKENSHLAIRMDILRWKHLNIVIMVNLKMGNLMVKDTLSLQLLSTKVYFAKV